MRGADRDRGREGRIERGGEKKRKRQGEKKGSK